MVGEAIGEVDFVTDARCPYIVGGNRLAMSSILNILIALPLIPTLAFGPPGVLIATAGLLIKFWLIFWMNVWVLYIAPNL